MSQSKQLVWLITGTSSGMGRNLSLAALARGDKVIATARHNSLAKLDDIKAEGAESIGLDVTASLDELKETAKAAVEIYGRVDVLVNNAGYMLVGALEENTPEETLNQFNTNVFGALNVARAFLPYMRERKSGTIVWLGSVGGWQGNPSFGVYCASKHAVRALSQTLNVEISPLGLRSICVELGAFRTAFLSAGSRSSYTPRIDDYKQITTRSTAGVEAFNQKQPGDPKKGVQVIIDLVRGEGVAEGKGKDEIPGVINLGSDCYETVKGVCEGNLKRLEAWKDVSKSTDF
ncbi:hypothetical protein JAAARDRAFT_157871 [Jaapia argillacea MUCL 33604]|uniref:NAD(P)-binding protein n=1 Tax=Jaapia argillacea MUCL 33604 TaxID=933084 RepID=A0A067PPG7_9AGAM|nr:hypothetical protein JAAARDRAFT_157871 [Jaapia argillacea MUCL 33604]